MLFEMDRRYMLWNILQTIFRSSSVFPIWIFFYGTIDIPAELSSVKYMFWWTYFERTNKWKSSQPLFKSKFTRNFSLNLLKAIGRTGKGAVVIQWNKYEIECINSTIRSRGGSLGGVTLYSGVIFEILLRSRSFSGGQGVRRAEQLHTMARDAPKWTMEYYGIIEV